jgi:hypothetical protein
METRLEATLVVAAPDSGTTCGAGGSVEGPPKRRSESTRPPGRISRPQHRPREACLSRDCQQLAGSPPVRNQRSPPMPFATVTDARLFPRTTTHSLNRPPVPQEDRLFPHPREDVGGMAPLPRDPVAQTLPFRAERLPLLGLLPLRFKLGLQLPALLPIEVLGRLSQDQETTDHSFPAHAGRGRGLSRAAPT